MNIKLTRWVLRIAVAGEFIGHGVFALQGKKAWIEWFSVFGISDTGLATQLLFLTGALDISLAILLLLKPVRLAPLALLLLIGWPKSFKELFR